jgi:hypothetical protein
MMATQPKRWCLVTSSEESVFVRRSDGELVSMLPFESAPGTVSTVLPSRFEPVAVALNYEGDRLAFLDLKRGAIERQSLAGGAAGLEAVQGDGECVVLKGERGVQLVTRDGRAITLEKKTLLAVAPERHGFVVLEATQHGLAEARRLHIDASGPVRSEALVSYDVGARPAVLLGLAIGAGAQLVSQFLPPVADFKPPWVVVLEPHQSPRHIARAWVGRSQAVVRGEWLFFFEASNRSLRRLRLSEGSPVELAHPDLKNVVALDADATVALCRSAETVAGARSMGFVYELRDVDTGALIERAVVDGNEVVASWLVDARHP